ncbi:MAG TPA: FxLYD domain-containing protein [Blastocatellia bacterium]|nr:FxLYD domain-containing protein [Blastocatellia bacterium]
MENDTQLAVFENDNDNEGERDRSRALLVGGAIAALILAVVIAALVMTNPGGEKERENLVRPGSPEFDAYKDKVALQIDDDSKMVHPNMIGMWQLAVTATLSNRGDRELTGVEVTGKMIDLEDKVIAHASIRPIPSNRNAPLKPGESMSVKIKVDAPAKVTEGEVKDILMELSGLRFQ